MTKFAMINLNDSCNKKNQIAFSKQYTSHNLKTLLKCKEVIDLYNVDYDENKLQSIAEIDENIFEKFVDEISDFDIYSLTENNRNKRDTQKYFAFSDDVSCASFALKEIKNKVNITFFELNDEDDFDTLTESIESIKSNKDSIRSLYNAKEAIESPRVLRRLQTLRRWSHEQEIESFFTRDARTRCTHGAGTPGRVPIPVGSH